MTAAPPDRGDQTTSIHVRRAAEGDEESLSWVVERFAPPLLAQARYRLGGLPKGLYDPEDLVQDTWAVALPRLSELEPRDGRLTPVLMRFLGTTLLYRSNTLYKKHFQGKPLMEGRQGILDSLPIQVSGVVTRAVRAESSDSLHEALAELSDEDREIILLRGIEQNRNETVAELLGLKPNTVAVKYRRALVRLKERLGRSVFDDLEG